MASTVAAADALDTLTSIEQVYAFRDGPAIRAFLGAHPDVLGLLAEAEGRIASVFPSRRPIALEVLHDHEDEGEEGELFAVVATELDPEEALARMAELRRSWLVDAVRRGQGRFNVAVEYV